MDRLTAEQAAEVGKYAVAYRDPKYRMGRRLPVCAEALSELPVRGAYLDVSCGRGEMLSHARSIGFRPVWGTEIVDALTGERDGNRVVKASAWDLPWPDRAFDVVSMFDVIEHLLPGDDERAVRELGRVAGSFVLITANNRESIHAGMELHVNRRPYEEWDALFRAWFPGTVMWLKDRRAKRSEMWRVDLRGRR